MNSIEDSEISDPPHPSQSSTRKRTWYPATWIWRYLLKGLNFCNRVDSTDSSKHPFGSDHDESILPELNLIGPTSPLRYLRRTSTEERSGQSVFLLFGQSNHSAVEVPCMRPTFSRQIASYSKANVENPSCEMNTRRHGSFVNCMPRSHENAKCWQCCGLGCGSAAFCPACGAPQRQKDYDRAIRDIIATLKSDGAVEDSYHGFKGKIGYRYVPMKTIEASREDDCEILSRILEYVQNVYGRYFFLLRLVKIVSVTEKKFVFTGPAQQGVYPISLFQNYTSLPQWKQLAFESHRKALQRLRHPKDALYDNEVKRTQRDCARLDQYDLFRQLILNPPAQRHENIQVLDGMYHRSCIYNKEDFAYQNHVPSLSNAGEYGGYVFVGLHIECAWRFNPSQWYIKPPYAAILIIAIIFIAIAWKTITGDWNVAMGGGSLGVGLVSIVLTMRLLKRDKAKKA